MSDIVRDAIAASLAALVPLSSTPSGDLGYGVDIVCIDDIDPRLAETDPLGIAGLAQDAYHRITTRRGSIPDDPDYGIDITSFLSRGTTSAQLANMGGNIESEILKDDRFDTVTADVAGSADGKTLDIKVTITPIDETTGIFTLIVSVTNGATLLSEILA